jgi:uncharacterized protein YjaZ
VDHLQHLGLAVAGEVLVDVDLAEGLAERAVDAVEQRFQRARCSGWPSRMRP